LHLTSFLQSSLFRISSWDQFSTKLFRILQRFKQIVQLRVFVFMHNLKYLEWSSPSLSIHSITFSRHFPPFASHLNPFKVNHWIYFNALTKVILRGDFENSFSIMQYSTALTNPRYLLLLNRYLSIPITYPYCKAAIWPGSSEHA